MAGKRHDCRGLRPSPPGRDALELEAREACCGSLRPRCHTSWDGWIWRKLAKSRCHSRDGSCRRHVFFDVRRNRLLSQRPAGDCHHRNSPVSRSTVLRTREPRAGALQTPRRALQRKAVKRRSLTRTTEAGRLPSDHAGRSRNRRGTPNTLGCSACPALFAMLGGTQKVAPASVEEASHSSWLGSARSARLVTEPYGAVLPKRGIRVLNLTKFSESWLPFVFGFVSMLR